MFTTDAAILESAERGALEAFAAVSVDPDIAGFNSIRHAQTRRNIARAMPTANAFSLISRVPTSSITSRTHSRPPMLAVGQKFKKNLIFRYIIIKALQHKIMGLKREPLNIDLVINSNANSQ